MKSKKTSEEKIAIYIDGSNLYFSMKTLGSKIDIEKFCNKLGENTEIVKINFYIAPVNRISNPDGYTKQQKFFDVLRKINKLNIILGRMEKRKRDGKIYYVEKASDINLALDLVLDAQRGIYDKAFLVSNDGDFSTAVLSAVSFEKKIVYVAVGNKKSISHHLKEVASSTTNIDKEFLSNLELKE